MRSFLDSSSGNSLCHAGAVGTAMCRLLNVPTHDCAEKVNGTSAQWCRRSKGKRQVKYLHRVQEKKVPLVFFAVTFTNIDGFS